MKVPFSTDEAEAHIIAALLHDPMLLEDCPALDPTDFSDATLGELFKTIQDRVRLGRLVSPAALQVWAEGVGFPFQGLVNMHTYGASYASQVGALSEHVIRHATQRALRSLLDETLTKASQHGANPMEQISALEHALSKLNARGGVEGGYMTLREAMESSASAVNTPQAEGLRTGYSTLDKRLGGFMPGDLIIVAGRPGMGKSAFGINLARGWGYRGKLGHVASYEMSGEQIGDRSLGAAARVPYASIRRNPKGLDKDYLVSKAKRGPDSVYIHACPAQNVQQLLTSARETRRRLGGLDFIIVDYLQLMKGARRESTRNDEMTEVSQGLKSLGKQLHVPVIALAQLNRESDKDKRPPRLSELRESGAIEQDADVVLGLFRPAYFLEQEEPELTHPDYASWQDKWAEQKNQIFISTLKQRMGPTGKDELFAQLEHDIIRDLDAPVEPRRPRYSMMED